MTIIFIENLQGSGKAIKIVEDFGDYAVHRDLAPGERLHRRRQGQVAADRGNPAGRSPDQTRTLPRRDPAGASEPQLELRYA